jgi:superfamily I DNA/RNA helicase
VTVRTLAQRADAEVFAAGDDDQSIYSFRHAHPVGIRNFGDDFPGASKPFLTECLRCGQQIVDLANWLINQEAGRIPKNLISVTEWPGEVHLIRFRDQGGEAQDVATIIRAEVDGGAQPEDVLILLRSDPAGRVSRAIVEALAGQQLRAYLPRALRGDEERIQALVEYLILAQALEEENRIDDLALRSLLQLEPNGIGPTRLWAATTYCLERGIRFASGIDEFRNDPRTFPGTGVDGFLEAIDQVLERAAQFQQQADETFEDWLTRIAGILGIAGDDLDAVLAIGAEAQAEIERHDAEGLEGVTFAQAMAGSMSKVADTLPPTYPGFVTITTMHGAKGLSADVVFVLQAEDEALPGDAVGIAYDESRRLLYVSLTRARRKLFIGACERRSGPQRFIGEAEVVRRNLTRFLRDYGLVAETARQYIGI